MFTEIIISEKPASTSSNKKSKRARGAIQYLHLAKGCSPLTLRRNESYDGVEKLQMMTLGFLVPETEGKKKKAP